MKGAIRAETAAELIPEGARLLVGGFMAVGSPLRLLAALEARWTRGLTVFCNDLGTPEKAVGRRLRSGEPRDRLVHRPEPRRPEADDGGRARGRAGADG
jgi:acetate CoA/acetoacetate CoA-transferase alpha subunit